MKTGIKKTCIFSYHSIIALVRNKKLDILLIAIIIIISFIVRYINLMGAGITWDEPLTIMAGMKYGHNIETFNFISNSWTLVNEHGPISKYIYGLSLGLLGHRTLDYGAFVICKTASVLMGVATCVIVYLIGREFFNRPIALASSIILALTPPFIAHTQIAAIDGPVALFFTLTMYLFMMAVKRDNKYLYVSSAVSLGLLIDTKFNGLLAVPAMLLFYLLHRHKQPMEIKKQPQGSWKGKIRKSDMWTVVNHYIPAIPAVLFCLTTVTTVYMVWPWLWGDPVHNIIASLSHWSYTPIEYFLGQPQKAPIYYYPVYFLVTTPLLLFIPLMLGVFDTLKSKDEYKVAILLWPIVPFAYDFSSFIQDNIRYLLMIYPALAILIAQGLDYFARWIKTLHIPMAVGKNSFAIMSAVTIVYLILTAASVSPYYLDYYNALAGGPAGVHDNRLFEFGWWGEGIYDSVMYVENNAPPGSTVYVAAQPNHMVQYYGIKANYTYLTASEMNVTLPSTYDYIITNHFTDEYNNFSFNEIDYTLIHTTNVQGTPIVSVYKRSF